MKKIMTLGSGELGKEFIIAAQRLGCTCIAVDRYDEAPAMQVADFKAVINMQDANLLKETVSKFQPDIIVPEVEAIATEALKEFEKQNIQVVPTAYATHLTMNRDAIRDLAADELDLRTARYDYAESIEELKTISEKIGFPLVIKPVMSSSGKGQSKVDSQEEIEKAWEYAKKGRGDRVKVIAEEFIDFYGEITLLTIKQRNGETLYCEPIGHIQENGDYRESWQPFELPAKHLEAAQEMAKKVTDALGGSGLFGVEFFLTKEEVIFSELSPRPHDTGMVTMATQNLNEFELHLRAVLGLPIPNITCPTPGASAVILSKEEGVPQSYSGLGEALQEKQSEVRIFNKPMAYPGRRMGVALATAETVEMAREKAMKVASKIQIHFN